MIRGYKGRSIKADKPVRVYRNLNKKCFSVMQHGVVVAHADSICMLDVKFSVSESGRQRVIREGRKNVHAFVEGMVVGGLRLSTSVPVQYNPYTQSSFTADGQPVYQADAAVLKKGVCFINPIQG